MMPAAPLAHAGKVPVHGLDLVRFLAAMLVAIYHLGFKARAIGGSTLNTALGMLDRFPPGYRFTWWGWIGVQVFFVVSGAVIAYSARGSDASGFALRRVERLLPALIVAVAIAVPVAIGIFGMAAAQAGWLALKTLAFVPWGPWIIGQFWTIPVEVAFYAAVCVLLAAGGGNRVMDILAWWLGLASCAYWLLVTLGMVAPGGRLSELLLLQHGVYFALGIVCARLGDERLSRRHVALALACLIAAAAQVQAAAGWEMASRPDLATGWPVAWLVWLALVVLVAASFRWREAVAARLARHAAALRLLGLSTYPLYLVHIHIGGAVLILASGAGAGVSCALAVMASLAVSLAIAAWGEPPLHALVRRCMTLAAQWARLRLPRPRAVQTGTD